MVVGPYSVHDIFRPPVPAFADAGEDDADGDDHGDSEPGEVADRRVKELRPRVHHGLPAGHVGVEGDGAAVAVVVARVVHGLDVLHLHRAPNRRSLPLQHRLVRRSSSSDSFSLVGHFYQHSATASGPRA